MKKLKRKASKALALLLACVMALSMCSSAFATTVEEETTTEAAVVEETTAEETAESEAEVETTVEAEETTEAAEAETTEEAEEITADENTSLKSAAADTNDGSEAEEETTTESGITKIQAEVVDSFYGYKVGYVYITYSDESLMPEDIDVDTYTVYDRGFNNPEFGALDIDSMTVDGTTVTLNIDQDTDATAERSRETYGTLCTSSSWFIDEEGNLFYGSTDSTDALGITMHANTLGKGLQEREPRPDPLRG